MNPRCKRKRRYSFLSPVVLLFLVSVTSASTHPLPHLSQNEPGTGDARERIGELMKETLAKRDSLGPDGRKVWLLIPPSPETIDQLRACGPAAVPVLAEYSRSGSYHERELALEFLHDIGGEKVAGPLAMAARTEAEPRLREDALRYLSDQSWKVAGPILKEASLADPDPKVREYVIYELESHEARIRDTTSESQVRKRISSIIRHTIQKASFVTPDGLRVQTVARATNEEIKEIQGYGDAAVPILSEFLSSKDDREKDLAIRLLGILGGGRVVEPLARVVRTDTSPAAREMAIRWLAQAPWDLASPVIFEAARNDADAAVRQTAQEVLDARSPKQ